MSELEKTEIPENRNRIVREGRKAGLTLIQQGSEVGAKETMLELLHALKPIAQLLDKANDHNLHSEALNQQFAKVNDPGLTPSAQIIEAMRAKDESFFEFAMRKTKQHQNELMQPLSETRQIELSEQVQQSLAQQKQREESDSLSFDDYLDAYFNETLN